jgi:hypothetical protein
LAQVKGFNCGSVERRTRSQIRLMTRGGGRRRRRRALLWQPPAAPHRSGSARQRKPSRDLNRRKFHQLAARFKAQQEMSPRNPPISSSLALARRWPGCDCRFLRRAQPERCDAPYSPRCLWAALFLPLSRFDIWRYGVPAPSSRGDEQVVRGRRRIDTLAKYIYSLLLPDIFAISDAFRILYT